MSKPDTAVTFTKEEIDAAKREGARMAEELRGGAQRRCT